MKHIKRFLLIVFLSNACTNLKAKSIVNDTAQISYWYIEGFKNRIKKPRYSFTCAVKGLTLCKNNTSLFHKARILNLLGLLYYRNGELQKAEMLQKQALLFWRSCLNEEGEALSLNNLANVYSEMERYTAAEINYLKALHIQTQKRNQSQITNCFINLGVLKFQQSEFETAEYYLNAALKNAEKHFDYDAKAMCLNNLAAIHLERKNYDQAIANCYNSIELKTMCGNEAEKADSYLTLAAIFEQLGNRKEMKNSLESAHDVIQTFHYKKAEKEYYALLSQYHILIKDFENACLVLKKSLAIHDSTFRAEGAANISSLPEISKELIGREQKDARFPLLYLNILILVAILTAVNIFRLRA